MTVDSRRGLCPCSRTIGPRRVGAEVGFCRWGAGSRLVTHSGFPMRNISSKLKGFWLPVALVAGALCVASLGAEASGQSSRVGRVVGYIDGISNDGGQFLVSGWACQQGNPGSIDVHIYADRSAYDKLPGKFVTAGKADLQSEPAVSQACQDQKGGKHRFKIALSNQLLRTYHKRKLYAHGIAIVGNVENAAIAGL